MTGRGQLAWAGGWLVTLSAGLLLVGSVGERWPVSAVAVGIGALVPCVGIGLVLRRFRWSLLGGVFVPIAVVAAIQTGFPLLVLLALIAVPAAAAAIALGVLAGKVIGRRPSRAGERPPVLLVGAGAVLVCVSFLPFALAYVEKHRTVRIDRSSPLTIDGHRGTIGGVGLADPPSRVTARFGPPIARRRDTLLGSRDTQQEDYFLGPRQLPSLPREQYLAYPHEFFATGRGHVRYVEVTDRNARLLHGYGPGDSISLISRAYPQLTCNEGDARADRPYPYPRCYGRVSPRVYVYIGGDYHEPGAPIKEIWIADFPLVGGS